MKHKCDGCKYKGQYQEMKFRPFNICLKETDIISAEKTYKADKCPYYENLKGNIMTTKQEIELINTIIREAIRHGGDAGGSYNSNKKKLTAAIEVLLNAKYLQGIYTVKPTYSDETGEYPLQIVPTENCEKEKELNEIINKLEKW